MIVRDKLKRPFNNNCIKLFGIFHIFFIYIAVKFLSVGNELTLTLESRSVCQDGYKWNLIIVTVNTTFMILIFI